MLGMNKDQEKSAFVEFFIEELQDIYWAEQHLAKALPKLQKAATSEQLAAAFEKHTRETEEQIRIVEEVFALLGEGPKAKKCDAMAGLLDEADSIVSDTDKDSFTCDAGLILAAQKVEHYEIATYGTLAVFAAHLEDSQVESLLRRILQNEKDTDVALTVVAESYVNERAVAE
ncbi:MAG: ferritin-like domain-containing protein [Tannerellaceae bacterium]|nr:ferritin-like domain-containing protein [Tannerellaceae bacterium]